MWSCAADYLLEEAVEAALMLVSQLPFGEPTPVTLSQPLTVTRDESWSNVRTL